MKLRRKLMTLLCVLSSLSFSGSVSAWNLWGTADYNKLYFAMGTLHLHLEMKKKDKTLYRINNNMLGVSYKGFALSTFFNSFDERVYSATLERALWKHESGEVKESVGYDVGLIYGYKHPEDIEIFQGLVKGWPVIPVADLHYSLLYHHLGLRVMYAGNIVAVSSFISFS